MAGPESAETVARAPRMQHAIVRAVEGLAHDTGVSIYAVIVEIEAALTSGV